MRNLFLDPYAASDIDRFVAKVLADLGNPDPPLHLTDVRQLLQLDKSFYSSTDDSAIREVAHKLKVAGQQVLARPSILKEVIGKFGLKALLLPDRRRILIDSETPDLKQRWSEAHEIAHALIPWHADTMLGDNQSTLTPSCHQQIEAEANYAAGQLLFLHDRFVQELQSLSPGMEAVRSLRDRYGNTLTTTLWRYVEFSPSAVVGAISGHPHRTAENFSLRNPLRYLIRSRTFEQRFHAVTESEVYCGIRSYCENRSGGTLGTGILRFFDDDGFPHLFQFETFFNRHEALTLGFHLRPEGTPVLI